VHTDLAARPAERLAACSWASTVWNRLNGGHYCTSAIHVCPSTRTDSKAACKQPGLST